MIDLILHYISSALDTLFLTYEVPRGGQDEKMVIWVQLKYVFFPSLSLFQSPAQRQAHGKYKSNLLN